MDKFKCFLMVGILAFLSSFTSCDSSEKESSPITMGKGIYKVEAVVNGDLKGFSPIIMINSFYPSTASKKNLFDENGSPLSTNSDGASYDEAPEFFSKPIIRSTSKEGIGLYVVVTSGTTVLKENLQEIPISKVTVMLKIYFNDKLIKSETQEIDNLLREEGKSDCTIALGDISQITKQWE